MDAEEGENGRDAGKEITVINCDLDQTDPQNASKWYNARLGVLGNFRNTLLVCLGYSARFGVKVRQEGLSLQ